MFSSEIVMQRDVIRVREAVEWGEELKRKEERRESRRKKRKGRKKGKKEGRKERERERRKRKREGDKTEKGGGGEVPGALAHIVEGDGAACAQSPSLENRTGAGGREYCVSYTFLRFVVGAWL